MSREPIRWFRDGGSISIQLNFRERCLICYRPVTEADSYSVVFELNCPQLLELLKGRRICLSCVQEGGGGDDDDPPADPVPDPVEDRELCCV